MLFTLTTTHHPATDLGYLLHKHPDRLQTFDQSFGQAHVFYPEVSAARTTAALLLDVDPIGMVRGKRREQSSFLLGHYVNDRPYVASSFLSVAIAQVFGTALAGRCKDREELSRTPIPLSARLEVLPVRGGEAFARRIFEPLGYAVEMTQHPLDERFPEWGESPYFSLNISATKTLSELLTHLYVLVPVFDNRKHYFVGDDELEKLLAKGSGWLAAHPERDQISRRYLGHRTTLYREALARLADDAPLEEPGDAAASISAEESLVYTSRKHAAQTRESPFSPGGRRVGDEGDKLPETPQFTLTPDPSPIKGEGRKKCVDTDADESLEQPQSLNEQRHDAVLAALKSSGAKSVVDLGCGEGKLLQKLLADRQFERIVGIDVSVRALEIANRRLRLERLPDGQAGRITLLHGSLMYRDRRMANFDAACVVEVVEHLDAPRLSAFERVLFEFARPKTIVLTTPNREYNVLWETLPAGQLRHADHRFEWTREEFQDWSKRVAERYGYGVQFVAVGPVDGAVGSPTQMGVFVGSTNNDG